MCVRVFENTERKGGERERGAQKHARHFYFSFPNFREISLNFRIRLKIGNVNFYIRIELVHFLEWVEPK